MTPNPRQFNLFAEATRVDRLETAWARVKANAGCGGADGVTIERFEERLAQRLLGLHRALRDGTYEPHELRLLEVPKDEGEVRRLAVPTVRDRIAQTAVAQVLTPVLDPELEPASFAYRPGRSVQQAVALIARYRNEGFSHVVEGDIERYFDRVPYALLLHRLEETLAEWPGSGLLLDLVGLWLEAWGRDLGTPGIGLAQGSPLSPLLSNLYLDEVDEAFARDGRGLRLVRFGDDFVILAKAEARAGAALERMRELLRAQGLGLNPDKTGIVSFDQGFRFLGHLFVRSMVLKSVDTDGAAEGAPDAASELLRWIARQDAETAAAAARAEADRAAGLEPGLRVLYLREPGRVLGVRNLAFTVEEEALGVRRELLAIPHHRVDRIELGPGCTAEDEAIRHVFTTDTVLHYVNGHGQTLGVVAAPNHDHGGLHLAQARTVLDPALRLDLARRIVEGRLRNQRALLHRLGRGIDRTGLVPRIAAISKLLRKLAIAADVPELLGFEGAAAREFWPALALLVRPRWALASRRNFRRRRRPAPDPFNVMLNYLSGMLGRDVEALCVRHGLHPGFGALHSAADGQDACMYDLIEELRAPLIEGLAVYLLNNRVMDETLFQRLDDGGWRLARGGHAPLIRGFERWLERDIKSPRTGDRLRWRRLVEEQVRAYARHCRGEELYRAYVMDY
jgi:CRISP-associated protein Cas1